LSGAPPIFDGLGNAGRPNLIDLPCGGTVGQTADVVHHRNYTAVGTHHTAKETVMNLKKLGTALVVVLALGAVMASSAFAVATTTDVKWRDSAGEITGSPEMSMAETENFILTSTIAGSPLELKSTAISCSGCTITNSTGSATGHGQIVFENVTVPSNPLCAVEGGKVATTLLEISADWMIGTRNLAKVTRNPNEGTTLATVKIVKGTGACPIAGSYPVTGSVFGESLNPTSTPGEIQGIKFTKLINEEAGGALKFKAEPASIKGAAVACTKLATMSFFTA
jgi:hypothetical protein